MFPVPLRIAFSRSGTLRVQLKPLTCVIRRMLIQTSSVFFPHTPRDIDFSDVSLKTLRVLVYRRIFRPSHVHLHAGATVSRPHNCQPQWFANNSLWAAAWATTMLFRVVEQMTGPSAFDFVVPVHPSRCSLACTIQSGSFSGYSRLQRRQFFSVTSSLPSATVGFW